MGFGSCPQETFWLLGRIGTHLEHRWRQGVSIDNRCSLGKLAREEWLDWDVIREGFPGYLCGRYPRREGQCGRGEVKPL